MAVSESAVRVTVESLNENINRLNTFVADSSEVGEFQTLHFVGTIEPESAEKAIIEHWDEFIQDSRVALNADDLSRTEMLAFIDGINLDYKRLLEAVQD